MIAVVMPIKWGHYTLIFPGRTIAKLQIWVGARRVRLAERSRKFAELEL